ncbi:restriction endonuclease subunit S [Sulfitobacter mediterraneus]|uniref:restriction endonuclease subunit S n=1 Tax=Sulfitobacter mediterraneus TaxID=83219 RepID=UPI00193302B8|nr:restriction endonuclease subunit S [Sulfitobacter mediterraneus]MBM1311902.1 restriction endonuclease subunit S [Sulfitobacter mediterraneus]MBM1315783.1 restriction endonuclease subunit S [Sulfitobacter mediterraneus]MBM1324145.1 restriction endonuclease subunit S [Sulfitobacter mediterraneus]MBM1328057.1 restriction endonuclease subunit S [Sulfitobacter mediterraneus]MBM1399405.1 restriction endonuclease subunit S [Sulfitobacter mediterraneus]
MSWQQVQLGEVADIISGATPKSTVPDFWGGEIAWATPTDLSNLKAKHIASTERRITDTGLKSCAARLLPPNSVLFSSRAPIGLVAINKTPMATNQGFKSFVPSADLNADYLYWWLVANKQQIQDLGNGATFKEVSKGIVSKVKIPLPPVDEQSRIAAILDKADAIRRKRQQALALAEDFHKSMFLEMFGDELFDQDKASYRSIADLIDDGSIVGMQDGNHGEIHPKLKDFSTSGTPFVAANMIRTGRLITNGAHHLQDIWLKKLRIGFAKPRDVLLSHKGSIGFVAIVGADTPQLILSPQVTYYRTNQQKIIPEYLAAYFRSGVFQAELEKFSKQSTRAYVGITRQKSLHIVVPETRKQKKFCEVVSKLEAAIPTLKASTDQADILFASLSRRAFRGEL